MPTKSAKCCGLSQQPPFVPLWFSPCKVMGKASLLKRGIMCIFICALIRDHVYNTLFTSRSQVGPRILNTGQSRVLSDCRPHSYRLNIPGNWLGWLRSGLCVNGKSRWRLVTPTHHRGPTRVKPCSIPRSDCQVRFFGTFSNWGPTQKKPFFSFGVKAV